VTDPLTHNTTYSYDGLGNRLTTNSPDSGQSQISYDTAGNPISSIDARGQTVNYRYDALNRVTQTLYSNNPPINFTYDQGANGLGRLTQMSDVAGITLWTYDLQGRITSKTFKNGALTLVTRYSYTSDGRLATLTYPSGKVVQLSYNNNGQITEIDGNGSPLLSSINYQPFGPVQSWIFGNGVKTNRSFDFDGRLIAYDMGDRLRQLTFDVAGRITGYTDTDLNHDQSFTYDELNRLIGYSDPTMQTHYSYDANGNRTQQTDGTQSKIFNLEASSNRLLAISDVNLQPIKNYTYDASGHLVSDGNNQFTYDSRGRLVQTASASLGVEQYRINGLGQRLAKLNGTPPDLTGDANQDSTLTVTDLRLIVLMTLGSVPVNLAGDCNHDGEISIADAICTQAKIIDMRINPGKYVQTGTYFVYDEAGYLLGEYNQNGTALQETVWLGDMPVAVLKDNNPYFVYADHLNAPRAISDTTGTVVWRWDSEAFGTTLANQDPDGNGAQFVYNLRFPGQYFDKGTGLHYNNFRDYDPSTGRYIESDPIGLAGGINTYGYELNDPVNTVDFSGNNPWTTITIHIDKNGVDHAVEFDVFEDYLIPKINPQPSPFKPIEDMMWIEQFHRANQCPLSEPKQDQAPRSAPPSLPKPFRSPFPAQWNIPARTA
jgi:RHS repeat-associated protein